MFGTFEEDGDEGFECLLALPLGGERQRRIALLGKWQRQYRRKQRHRFFHGKSVLAQRVFEFSYLLVRSLLSVKPQHPLEQISQRKQCRILIVLRTPTFPAGMRFMGDVVFQRLD